MNFKVLVLFFVLAASGTAFAQNDTLTLAKTPSDSIVKQDLAKNAEFFSQGIEAKYNQNFPLAIQNFEEALKYYTEDDASMYELSLLYQLTGRNTEAFSMIEQAAILQPDNKWYQIRLAQFYLQNADYQGFMSIYDKLLSEEPENMDYLETYIEMLLRIGDYDKVIEKLNVLEEQMGENEYISLQKIEIYKEKGDNDKAIKELEHLVSITPDNTQYMAMLAERYMQAKRPKDAYKIYLKIKETDPNDKYINISLMEYYQSVGEVDKAFDELIAAINNKNLDYDTKVQINQLWFQSKNQDEFDSYAQEIGQAFINAHPDKSLGYFLIAANSFESKEYVKAKEYYIKALEIDKTHYVYLYQLTVCYIELKDFQNALATGEIALSYYPEQPMLYMLQSISYINLKELEKAIQMLEKGRKFSGDKELTATFDAQLGDIYHQLDNKEKAFEAYERVLRLEPNNVGVLNNYAYYLSTDSGDLEKALQMSGKTIEAEPHNPIYLDTYAWVLYKLGRYQEAKKYMEKVFKYDKNPNGTNYEHYGDVLFQLGDKKGAVKNWKKAKRLGDEVSDLLDKKIKDEQLYE